MEAKKKKVEDKKKISDLMRVGTGVLEKRAGIIVSSDFGDVTVIFLRDLLSSCGHAGSLGGCAVTERDSEGGGRGWDGGSPARENSCRCACNTR